MRLWKPREWLTKSGNAQGRPLRNMDERWGGSKKNCSLIPNTVAEVHYLTSRVFYILIYYQDIYLTDILPHVWNHIGKRLLTIALK